MVQNKNSVDGGYEVFFRIGGHLIGIYWPGHLDFRECLPTFVAFLEEEPIETEAIMRIEVQTSAMREGVKGRRLLSDVSIQWGDRFRFEESEKLYITTVLSESSKRPWTMHSTKDFKRSSVHVIEDELKDSSVLNWLIMVSYGQAVLLHRSMLIHASVIENGSEGFAFLGKSGTGKSTHSRLWIAHIPNVRLLNDDNPVVLIDAQGCVWIYGTPWSGKTSCYRNHRVKLEGIVRLTQAKVNRWTRVASKDALLSFLPSCTSIRWNKMLFSHMVDTVEQVVASVPVAGLECLPNEEAARLCYQKLNEIFKTKTI